MIFSLNSLNGSNSSNGFVKRLKRIKTITLLHGGKTMAAKYFEDLEVWILSRELTNKIYNVSSDGRFAKDFGLRDQIRKAAVSIMSNIACPVK